MGNLNKNAAVTLSECPKVIKPIEERMWRLLAEINRNKALSHRLFGVEFLATDSGECLVTMLYHRRLEEAWLEVATPLEAQLDISLIGRSRKQKVVLSQSYVTERLTIAKRVYTYRHYEGGFTQPNPLVNAKMITWAIDQIKDDNREHLLESYCGLGNFTLPLSILFTKVLATEISKNSIYAAKENCALNEIEHIEFVRLSSEEMTQALNKQRAFRRLEGIDLEGYHFSHVLVDPPRAGLDSDTITLISQIDTILYISCNPETLARDLEHLTQTHEVTAAAIFDQFPHTAHIESGVILRRSV
jgi:tRNA (uracil-5-)-methyltransferase